VSAELGFKSWIWARTHTYSAGRSARKSGATRWWRHCTSKKSTERFESLSQFLVLGKPVISPVCCQSSDCSAFQFISCRQTSEFSSCGCLPRSGMHV